MDKNSRYFRIDWVEGEKEGDWVKVFSFITASSYSFIQETSITFTLYLHLGTCHAADKYLCHQANSDITEMGI